MTATTIHHPGFRTAFELSADDAALFRRAPARIAEHFREGDGGFPLGDFADWRHAISGALEGRRSDAKKRLDQLQERAESREMLDGDAVAAIVPTMIETEVYCVRAEIWRSVQDAMRATNGDYSRVSAAILYPDAWKRRDNESEEFHDRRRGGLKAAAEARAAAIHGAFTAVLVAALDRAVPTLGAMVDAVSAAAPMPRGRINREIATRVRAALWPAMLAALPAAFEAARAERAKIFAEIGVQDWPEDVAPGVRYAINLVRRDAEMRCPSITAEA